MVKFTTASRVYKHVPQWYTSNRNLSLLVAQLLTCVHGGHETLSLCRRKMLENHGNRTYLRAQEGNEVSLLNFRQHRLRPRVGT